VAKCQFGPLVADVRGKIGAVEFASNHYGTWIGRKGTPRNPGSATQAAMRATLKTLAWRWGWVLNQTPQRDGWTALGLATDWTDVFGQTYHLHGYALYVLVNQNLVRLGEAIMDDDPAVLSCGSPGGSTITFNGGAALLADSTIAPAANEHAVVWAAAPCSPGISVFGRKYRIIDVFGAAVAGPWDIKDKYETKFGLLPSGMMIPALVNFTSDLCGWQGTPAEATGIVP
jgi:hypothetical protein